jgi:hypothetical protein
MSARSRQIAANSVAVLGALPLAYLYVLMAMRNVFPNAGVLLSFLAFAYFAALLVSLPAGVYGVRLFLDNPKLPRFVSSVIYAIVAVLLLLPVLFALLVFLSSGLSWPRL